MPCAMIYGLLYTTRRYTKNSDVLGGNSNQMSRLPSEVKIADFVSTTQRNGDIITAISLPNANPGIVVLVLRKCYIRSIFRQFERIATIARGGPAYLTILFDKVKFFYTPVTDEV